MTGRSLRCSLSFVALALAATSVHAETLKVKAGESIQVAIDAAAVNADADDVISVAKGVYKENLVISEDGLTLKGSSATINGAFTGNCITVNANNVTIQSMVLVNGGGAPPPLDGGPPADTGGILATGDGITLSKLTINSCEDFGIRLVGNGGKVDGCKVDACLARGIDVSTGDELSEPSPELTVINKNTVSRCENGIRLDKGPFTVTSNTVTACTDEGMEVNLGLDSVAPTTVSKNKFNNNLGTGLIVNHPDGFPVGTNVLVDKNTMDENGVGLLLEGANIDALSNTISDSVGDGVVVETGALSLLDKNKVTNSGLVGIRVIGFNNKLTKNTVQNSGEDGIYITGNTTLLDGNTVKDGEGDGIQIAQDVLSTTVNKCTVTGNEHDGIDNSGTITIIIGCTSKTNGGADIAGRGNGGGDVSELVSVDNKVSDDSDIVDFQTVQELEMPQP